MKGILVGMLLLAPTACAPMKHANLTTTTSIQDVKAVAMRQEPGGWEICLSLPSSFADWSVSLDEPYAISRQDERGRANYSWAIPPERWRNPEPFKLRVKASGIDEVVAVSHPTREDTLARGAEILLDILFLPSKIPHL